MILEHHFAMGYTNDDFGIVLDKIEDLIKHPMPNKLFHRPLLEFQLVYGHFGQLMDVFYLFVTDLADRPNYIEDEIKKLSKSIHEIGSLEEKKDDILEEIRELHSNLHAKIAIVGPVGAGKTKLARMLALDKEAPPRKIMTFAEVREIGIDKLKFDLWDFVMDNFSPLWNNYIRGSDLLLLLFNSTQVINNTVIHFINLSKREGKYSKIVFLLSHSNGPDGIDEDKFLSDYGELLPKAKILSYDTDNDNAEALVRSFVSDALMLKKGLPSEFREILIESNNAIGEKNYLKAIDGLRRLVKISKEHQEMEYLDTFEKKIIELEGKQEDHKRQMVLENARSRIKAPEKILFKDTFKIKTLPVMPKKTGNKEPQVPKKEKIEPYYEKFNRKRDSVFKKEINSDTGSKGEPKTESDTDSKTEPFIDDSSIPSPKMNLPNSGIQLPQPNLLKINESKNTFRENEEKINKTGIKDKRLTFERSPIIKLDTANDVEFQKSGPETDISKIGKNKERFQEIEEKVKTEQKSRLHNILTTTNIWNTKQVIPKTEEDEKFNSEVKLLKSEIKKRGKSLRHDLCEKYIFQVRKSLKKAELEEKDIINAALLYLKRLENP